MDLMEVPAKPSRNRRKSDKGSDSTKHRRTRSGCFTCRNRRVKCDESHPTCERCRKGGRECTYPDPPTSAKSKTAKGANIEKADSSSDEDEYDDLAEHSHLETIADIDEPKLSTNQIGGISASGAHRSSPSQSTSGQRINDRQTSETPSLVHDKGASPTPSTEGSVGYSPYQSVGTSRSSKPKNPPNGQPFNWSHLSQDLQFYLSYYYENLTFLHYSLKCDSGNFMKTTFIEKALQNDALLYALVGFSAFQYTIHNPRGKMQDFLQYYNKAVTLLLKSLKKGEERTNATILAILQLATIEEFLGDWINLLGHQKAAYQILIQLYTPQTVMDNQISRIILAWYSRFDVFAGLMGGFEMVLSREWFWRCEQYLQEQILNEPQQLSWKIEHIFAKIRRIAMDMSTVFAKIARGEITPEQFIRENEAVAQMIADWKTELDPALQDSRFLVMEYPNARPLDAGDILDPYVPGAIYRGPLWVMNSALIDWHSIDLMHRYQTALTLGGQPGPEIGQVAYTCSQIFETVELYHESPPGTILALQASLGIACLFLPRDEKHSMWARRKLATIESQGYIYPYTFRTKMSDLFRDRSCMQWWLPNNERYPPIIRSIRKFVEERSAPAVDDTTEDLKDMKSIFASLSI